MDLARVSFALPHSANLNPELFIRLMIPTPHMQYWSTSRRELPGQLSGFLYGVARFRIPGRTKARARLAVWLTTTV